MSLVGPFAVRLIHFVAFDRDLLESSRSLNHSETPRCSALSSCAFLHCLPYPCPGPGRRLPRLGRDLQRQGPHRLGLQDRREVRRQDRDHRQAFLRQGRHPHPCIRRRRKRHPGASTPPGRSFPGDSELRREFRAEVNADSGLFPSAAISIAGKCDYPVAGPYKMLKKHKAQDWNTIVVVVKGKTAHCTSNGEVLEAAYTVPPDGSASGSRQIAGRWSIGTFASRWRSEDRLWLAASRLAAAA